MNNLNLGRILTFITIVSFVGTLGFVFFTRNADEIDTQTTIVEAEAKRTRALIATLALATQLDSEQRIVDARLRRNLVNPSTGQPATWPMIRQTEHDQIKSIATTLHLTLNASTIDVDRSVHLTIDGNEDAILRDLDALDGLLLPIKPQTTSFAAKDRNTSEVVIVGTILGGPTK